MHIAMLYGVYLAISLALMVWVGRRLERYGRVFLADAFQSDAELAGAVKRVLLFGFYLINAGFVTWVLSTSRGLENARAAMEIVSDKIGGVLLVLGITHFLVLHFFRRLGKREHERSGHARAGNGGSGWSPESAPLGKVLD